ncbi:MAG: hypothetical protein GY926_19465 [bacterium]|nr:hypothetical protein [bacterium]
MDELKMSATIEMEVAATVSVTKLAEAFSGMGLFSQAEFFRVVADKFGRFAYDGGIRQRDWLALALCHERDGNHEAREWILLLSKAIQDEKAP